VKLLLATTSSGKLREQREALEGLGLEIVSLGELPALEPPDETGATFRENARLKALYYHRALGVPTVAEDAGLEVDALGGLPGVHSARWLGAETPYEVKNARLLEILLDVSEEDRAARYVSAAAFADEGEIAFECEATCEGRIALEPRGVAGFGYDAIFYYPPLGKTMAELSPQEKNAVSHRGKAMAALRRHFSGPSVGLSR
jgi:XTP/dITP diphosphohydrolase